jgi:hypothetical protein
LTITGKVRRLAVECEPPLLRYPEPLVNTQNFPVRNARVRFESDVESVLVTTEPSSLVAETVPVKGSDKEFLLSVRVPPDAAAGQINGVVRLVPEFKHSEKVLLPECRNSPVVAIPVIATVITNVSCLPPSVSFGRQQIADVCSETLVLSARDGTEFVIEDVHSASDCVVVRRLEESIAPNAYFVTLTASREGERQEELRFRIRDLARLMSYDVLVPIQYYGVTEVE